MPDRTRYVYYPRLKNTGVENTHISNYEVHNQRSATPIYYPPDSCSKSDSHARSVLSRVSTSILGGGRLPDWPRTCRPGVSPDQLGPWRGILWSSRRRRCMRNHFRRRRRRRLSSFRGEAHGSGGEIKSLVLCRYSLKLHFYSEYSRNHHAPYISFDFLFKRSRISFIIAVVIVFWKNKHRSDRLFV